jgi:hypothetical protein
MKLTAIVAAAVLALTSTFALAQSAGSTAGGNSKAGGPAAISPDTSRAHASMHMGRHHRHHHHR